MGFAVPHYASNTKKELMFVTTVPNREYTCQLINCHMFRNMLPVTGLRGLVRFGLLGKSRHIGLSSLQKTVPVEGTAHTMNTTETLLQCPDVVTQTRPVELRHGDCWNTMLNPCCHKQNTFP